MKFSLAVAMIPLSQLVALAKVAEECGFSSITMPDSLFFPERGATGYPYTADGVRMWDAKTPFVDPMIAAAFMGPGTSKIRFYPQVLELSSRNPLLLASQVGSVANLTGGRFGLGVGVGWAPEEFEWCGASPQGSRPASRRDARGTATGSRRRYGRTSRQVLRLRQAADEPGADRSRPHLHRRTFRGRIAPCSASG